MFLASKYNIHLVYFKFV